MEVRAKPGWQAVQRAVELHVRQFEGQDRQKLELEKNPGAHDVQSVLFEHSRQFAEQFTQSVPL